MIKNITINKTFINIINIIIIFLLLIFIFYKIHLEKFIPITGDELNSILVYSSNYKTLFLKNFPGNVTFFHLLGYINGKILGYDLILFRSLSFAFFILSIFFIVKITKETLPVYLFIFLALVSNYSMYLSLYNGYVFSSFIFILIFYLLKNLERNNFKNLNLILLFSFIQFYNHLVNLYLIFPIIIFLFYFYKIKFIKNFILFFIIPTTFFYLFSILLTGFAEEKLNNTNIFFVAKFIFSNFDEIFLNGFKRIFFYEAYANATKFNLKYLLANLYNFDKFFLIVFITSFLISILNLKTKKIDALYSYIILSHFIMFFLINKDPAPRIFTGFFPFYFLIIYEYLKNYFNLFVKKSSKIISIVLLLFFLINFNFENNINKSFYGTDLTYKENNISLKILDKNCDLSNNNFHELQKRNLYFNYLNKCNKKFDLNEFLIFYRSKSF